MKYPRLRELRTDASGPQAVLRRKKYIAFSQRASGAFFWRKRALKTPFPPA